MPRPSRSHLLNLARVVLGLGVLTEVSHALFGLGGHGIDSFVKDGVYTAVEFLAVLVCAAGALRHRENRLAWILLTVGLVAWTAGDFTWTVWLGDSANPPTPSIADWLYLAMYPVLYVAVMLLLRSRLRREGAAQWLDGAVVGLTIAAAGAGLVLPILLKTNSGHFLSDAVSLAYPIGDLVLLAMVGVAFSLAGWRPGRMWLLLGIGIAISATGDLIYVYQNAKGTYVVGGVLDAVWPLSMAVLAQAPWQPARRETRMAIVAPQTTVVTFASAVGALAVLVIAAFHRVTPVAIALAAGALLLAMLRGALTYRENLRMLRASAHQAVTDNLTELGNRRRLMDDLQAAARHAQVGHASTLVFFDLDGFKRYNDSFGHGAGDALLSRLAAALRQAVRGRGRAYRLGGDEFCVLLPERLGRDDPLVVAAAEALTEHGSGFTVGASHGLATIPDDAVSASAALQLADERMYADKSRRTSRNARGRTRDVLMQILSERTPGLADHVNGVGRLVRTLGREFALDSDQLDELLRAAELHDIGKLAVPDEILSKPGPLTASEWEFMRQHPIVGERILNADPALRPVARLVRASHERWDGGRLPGRCGRPCDPPRRADHRRLRRVRGDDLGPLLPGRPQPPRRRSPSSGVAPERSSTRPSSRRCAAGSSVRSPPARTRSGRWSRRSRSPVRAPRPRCSPPHLLVSDHPQGTAERCLAAGSWPDAMSASRHSGSQQPCRSSSSRTRSASAGGQLSVAGTELLQAPHPVGAGRHPAVGDALHDEVVLRVSRTVGAGVERQRLEVGLADLPQQRREVVRHARQRAAARRAG